MTGAARFGKLPASNSGSTMSAKSVLRWVLPAIALLVGFADLWRGGMTLAPIVLILGYCVFIPWAIWSKPGAEEAITDPAAYRPSYAYAGIASLVVLGLYVATLAPTTAMWDTSEYIAAAYTLGFPHPPGNPFFVLQFLKSLRQEGLLELDRGRGFWTFRIEAVAGAATTDNVIDLMTRKIQRLPPRTQRAFSWQRVQQSADACCSRSSIGR